MSVSLYFNLMDFPLIRKRKFCTHSWFQAIVIFFVWFCLRKVLSWFSEPFLWPTFTKKGWFHSGLSLLISFHPSCLFASIKENLSCGPVHKPAFQGRNRLEKEPESTYQKIEAWTHRLKGLSLHLFFMAEMYISGVKSYGSINRMNRITRSLDELSAVIMAITDSSFLAAFN